jgi:5-methyltetrahydrofolate--homocysteine methyltransferase
MADLKEITDALVGMDEAKLKSLVQEALDQGVAAKDILNGGLISGMDIIGQKMETGEMYIPEVLMCANAMAGIVETLKPLLGEGERSAAGRVVIGTVKDDLHDIGKNLVVLMLESAGFEVVDLGVDVPPENFVTAVKENNSAIVGISALLTTTMDMMKQTVEVIRGSEVGRSVKIMVGGAPINQAFADKIGADGYAADAGGASRLAKSFLQ